MSECRRVVNFGFLPDTVLGLPRRLQKPAWVSQRSVCLDRTSASSTSIPRYRTVLSNFVRPSRSWQARRLPVRL